MLSQPAQQSTSTTSAFPQLECDSVSVIDSELRRAERLVESALADDDWAVEPIDFEIPGTWLTSIVIPVYNEERWIEKVVRRVAALPMRKEMVVVDDCSRDGTAAILRRLEAELGLRLLLRTRNEGKGAALRTGFQAARGNILVVQDADLEYDPRDIPNLIRPIVQGRADVVYGSRFLDGAPHDRSLVHRLGNRALTTASNLLTGLRLTDMETCYKAFRKDAVEGIDLRQDRFGFEPEVTAKLARSGCRFSEVPVRYAPRSYRDGKKIGLRDLGNALYCIVRYAVHT